MSNPSGVGSADGPGGLSADPSAYRDARRELLGRPIGSRLARRRALASLTDDWIAEVFARSGMQSLGVSLIAVGGYGRGELTAGSDLDLLLLLPERVDPAAPEVAGMIDALWYPVWDSGVRVDHSVRSLAETRRTATSDIKVILGLLDARTVAGDADLGDRLASAALADWRALARTRLGELRDLVERRRASMGEAAHLLEPDLKEAYGGLRDASVLDAIAASWITDVPREGLAEARERLMDMRDALHDGAAAEGRRASDVLRTQDQEDVAERLGLGDRESLLRSLSDAARSVAYASDTTWHRVGRLLRERSRLQVRRRLRRPGPERVPLAEGVVVHDGESGLAVDARPERDPVLLLRLAAASAQAGLPVAPGALARLARDSAPMPVPWPSEARDAMVSLIGAGAGLVPVWEALDQHGLIVRLIPQWDLVRSAPQGNPVHVYRVDRHLVQTAAEAAAHVRDVARPDLLLIGALLHDIGKGQPGDHSEVGAVIAEAIAEAMGFPSEDRSVLVTLVRFHLLLAETATRRDLDDPVTAARVAEAVGSAECLDILRALTYADAAATGPGAWSEWKAALVDDLVERTRAHLAGVTAPPAPFIGHRHPHLLTSDGVDVILEPGSPASRIIVAAPDRPGLLGAIAGTLAVHRLEVKGADTETVGARAVTSWTVVPLYGDFPSLDLVRSDLLRALAGELDLGARLAHRRRSVAAAAPRVDFVPGAASEADVLEVRAHDEPALLHRIGDAITRAGASITAARVETLGSEVVDVFYLQRTDGRRLEPQDRARVAGAVLDRLQQADPPASAATA
jgi:[protein-PII] uridylyltransferase